MGYPFHGSHMACTMDIRCEFTFACALVSVEIEKADGYRSGPGHHSDVTHYVWCGQRATTRVWCSTYWRNSAASQDDIKRSGTYIIVHGNAGVRMLSIHCATSIDMRS